MNRLKKNRAVALLMCALSAFAPIQSGAEDIDIFVGSSAGSNQNPKILIILDNTANWSRQSQQWPGGLAQGQSEARAIQTVLNSVGASVNLGLMEFVTDANLPGGFIRQAIQPMDTTTKTAFAGQLTTIFNNINNPQEKHNSGVGYGDLMYDTYNYFSGGYSVSPSGVNAARADSNGYTTNYTQFKSPLSDANACGRNFVIFIGNPASSGPSADTPQNSAALNSSAIGGSTSPQIPYQNYTTTTATNSTNLGYTSQCYSSQSTCSTADFATQCVAGGAYSSCTCNATNTTTSLDTCAAGTQRYSVLGVTNSGGTTTTANSTATASNTGASSCYVSQTAESTAVTAGTEKGGLTCPGNTDVTSGGTRTVTTNTCTYAGGVQSTTATQNCPSTTSAAVQGTVTYPSAYTNGCYSNANSVPSSDTGTLSCPATATVGNTTTTYTCSYAVGNQGISTGCTSGKKFPVTQTLIPSSTTTTPSFKYNVVQTVSSAIQTTTTSSGTSATTLLGNTSTCYATGGEAAASTQFSSQCATYNGGCSTAAPTASAGQCTSGARYMVTGNATSTTLTATGTSYTPTDGANADEWARQLHKPIAKNAANGSDIIKQNITTYTIDVFNAQPSAGSTALLQSMAAVGGGKYFAAKDESQIVAALQKILAEIQSVNTTFASASLPVNATNRTQNANQVFIGTFRPDPDANPRWFGNLKQYAIGRVNGVLDLVDKDGSAATNPLTGFIADCASSFWTTDSSNYWGTLATAINPDPSSKCATSTSSNVYSDLPDGPTVEKGAVAEVLRKGNDPSAATPSYTVNRNMLTGTTNPLPAFDATSIPTNVNLVNFTLGKDVNNDTGSGGPLTSRTRPSIHGDVVHSRPLPVNYGTGGVTVYYGANDGTLRSVDATTAGSQGKERWSYVAPEFYAKLQRLQDNSPAVSYPNVVALGLPSAPKDYFFDGSIGIFQNADNSKVWIYPTQRRGGRMAYSFDVSTPTNNPTLKWRHGCPNLGDDTGCTTGSSSYSAIGQTWSTPNIAFIRGFSTTTPVVLMGGGYDKCEDADNQTPSCSAAKGRVIYLINADTGDIIRSFNTDRSVAADVSFIDINNDGSADYAYAADTGGNIYRIDFVDGPTTVAPLASTSWAMRKVAYTNGGGRKFLFAPGVFPTGTTTYVALTSGDREHPLISNYPYTTPVVNRAYVYKDDLTALASVSTAAIDLDGASMIDFTNPANSTCSSDSLLSSSNVGKKGWYISLNAYGRGEQGVTSAVIVAGMVTFSTNRPIAQNQSCGSVLGEARGYFVNLFNASGTIGTANNASCGGERSGVFAGGGLPPSPVIGIVPINGIPTAVLIGAVDRSGGPPSPVKPTEIKPPITQIRTRTYKSIKGDN